MKDIVSWGQCSVDQRLTRAKIGNNNNNNNNKKATVPVEWYMLVSTFIFANAMKNVALRNKPCHENNYK